MSLQDFLTSTITIVTAAARDQWGEPTTTSSASVAARVVMKEEVVFDNTGAEVLSKGRVTIENTALTNEDKLTIDGVTYPIITIKNAVGRYGTTEFIKVFIR